MAEGNSMEENDITATEFESDIVDISWKLSLTPNGSEDVIGSYFTKSFQRKKHFPFLNGTWTITAVIGANCFAALRSIFRSNVKTEVTIESPSDSEFFARKGCSYVDGFIFWSDSSGRNFNYQLLRRSCGYRNFPITYSYTINTNDAPADGRMVTKDGLITLNCRLISKKLTSTSTEKKQDDGTLSLSSDFKELYASRRLSDFKLKVQDKEFPVHKAVLAARSRVFAAMFENNMTESRHNEVKITDIEANVISDLIEYMYTGRIPLMSCGKVISLYSACDKYTIEELKRKCVEFMIGNLSADNVCVISTLADYHMDCALKKAIHTFMRQHACQVVQTRRWKVFVKSKPYLAAEILGSVFTQEGSCETLSQPEVRITNPFASLDTAEEALKSNFVIFRTK